MKEIVNRRNLFKKIVSKILPVIALSIVPTMSMFSSTPRDCKGGCQSTCTGMCRVGCTAECNSTCKYRCKYGCGKVCKDMCEIVCTGCKGSCESGSNTSTIKTDSIKFKK